MIQMQTNLDVADKSGEIARIIECAPKSKTKTWEVLPKGGAAQEA